MTREKRSSFGSARPLTTCLTKPVPPPGSPQHAFTLICSPNVCVLFFFSFRLLARLSYDRQRGINIVIPPEEDNNITQKGTVMAEENPSHCGGHRKTEGKHLYSAKGGAFASQSSSAKHPEQAQLTGRNKCTDKSDLSCTTSSVRRVSARSFGKTVVGVPRDNSVAKGMTTGNSNTGGVAALMYAGRSASSLSGQPERARLFANAGRSTHSAAPLQGKRIEAHSLKYGTAPGSATSIPLPDPYTETVATNAQANIPAGATDVDSSSTPAAFIANGDRLQKRPLPRVATLASSSKSARVAGGAGGDDTSNKPPLLVKTQDFDPDKLECVLRHEASLAERAEQVENLRKATRRKSLFRARPLPAFLGERDRQGKYEMGVGWVGRGRGYNLDCSHSRCSSCAPSHATVTGYACGGVR